MTVCNIKPLTAMKHCWKCCKHYRLWCSTHIRCILML